MSMSCDNSDYSYATKYSLSQQLGHAPGPGHGHHQHPADNMTELLEEPVEEKPEQVGDEFFVSKCLCYGSGPCMVCQLVLLDLMKR